MEKKQYLFIILIGLVSICLILPSFPLTFQIYFSQTLFPKQYVPPYLKRGDILFCDLKSSTIKTAQFLDMKDIYTIPGYSNDHCLMYIGNNKFIESCPYYQTDTSTQIGVVITPYEFILIWATNITYGFVTTNQTIRNNAVTWATTQLGNPYGSEGYYCGELIWQAYNEQNIHLQHTLNNDLSFSARYPGLLRQADQISLYT